MSLWTFSGYPLWSLVPQPHKGHLLLSSRKDVMHNSYYKKKRNERETKKKKKSWGKHLRHWHRCLDYFSQELEWKGWRRHLLDLPGTCSFSLHLLSPHHQHSHVFKWSHLLDRITYLELYIAPQLVVALLPVAF